MTMPAISLWQPWASLLVTRQPCDACEGGHGYVAESCDERMVKRFETRSWPCPPSLIGRRFAIHAAKRTFSFGGPEAEMIRSMPLNAYRALGDSVRGDAEIAYNYPLGAIVGSGVVAACYSIVGSPLFGVEHILRRGDRLYLERYPSGPEGGKTTEPITGQLPYGDWTPGRYAWLIEDAAPTTERCPWCWGEGWIALDDTGDSSDGCPVCTTAGECGGTGRCDPIPARGRQRLWRWTPEVAA